MQERNDKKHCTDTEIPQITITPTHLSKIITAGKNSRALFSKNALSSQNSSSGVKPSRVQSPLDQILSGSKLVMPHTSV